MSQPCGICLGATRGKDVYHPLCLRRLFGGDDVPTIDIDLARMHTAALAMVGHTSLSGIQKKVSVRLGPDRATLQVALDGGRYILKPQAQTYPHLPENEHLTTCLATRVGLTTAPSGLVRLGDGSAAFITSRFDRLPDGRKLRQEDLCQLAGKSPKEKYDGTAELAFELVRRHAAEPLVELLKLFRMFVFAWWCGNGDMHLKNISLTVGLDRRPQLSPAYDLVCTRLVLPDDPQALPVRGRRDGLTGADWRALAAFGGLPAKAAERVLQSHVAALDAALGLVAVSTLPAEMKRVYRTLLVDRTQAIG